MIALSLFSLLLGLCFRLSWDGVLEYTYVFKLSSILYPTAMHSPLMYCLILVLGSGFADPTL